MKSYYQSLLLTLGALALAGAAYAQVPATNDTSATDGNGNTGMGTGALGGPAATNGGIENTAAGFDALKANTSGNFNTALGDDALASNTTGSENTACGGSALAAGATGSGNTALGFEALDANTGNNNTATGANTLFSNSSGNSNTASGYEALFLNSTGNYNTAAGGDALYSNTTGDSNTASGEGALRSNTTGINNSATGFQAMYSNTSGNYNTATGYDALHGNTTGSSNIAAGYKAGYNLTTGSSNIDIGSEGVAAENKTIRIGTAQTKTFIAGITGVSVTGSAVMVSATGQLGVTVSSERFKTAIAPMGSDTAKLELLRPVSFKLKSDATGTRQYGLIAEEVAKVYPELVIRDQAGGIDGVRYDELAPMLLNEVQQQASEMRDLKQKMAQLKAINEATQAAFRTLQAKDELMAQRR